MAYNLQKIRTLLIEGFSIDELRRFCFDHPDFKTVHHQLSPEMGKDKVIDRLLEYAEHSLQFEALLAWAKKHNPARYEAHRPYSEATTPPPNPKEVSPAEAASSVVIGDVSGGIHNSKIAGRDIIEIGIQIVAQAGLHLPPAHNLSAQLTALRQTLPLLVHPAEKASLQTAIEALKKALAALPGHEQAYLHRVQQRYARPAAVFVELMADTYEKSEQALINPETLDMATLADWLHRSETMPNLDELRVRGQEIKRVRLHSLRQGLDHYPCLIVLGEPGSGKTTALNHLAYQLAGEGLASLSKGQASSGKLPLLLSLSEFGPGQSVAEFIERCWRGSLQGSHWAAPELAANLAGYLEQGRMIILFDALNEMPAREYAQRVVALRDLIDQWHSQGNRFVVTCRLLDYGEELSGLQRVEVQPFSDGQIQSFLQKVLSRHWSSMWMALTLGGEEGHRLLTMARNPYGLTMMVSEFVRQQGQLSRNRAELITSFTNTLWRRAKAKCQPEAWLSEPVQREALAHLAYEMQQRDRSGTTVETALLKGLMPVQVQPDPHWPPVSTPPDQVLTLAASANIIEMPIDRSTVRFYHQLLQEYFAAHHLLKQVPHRLTTLWRWPWLETELPLWVRPEGNYDPLPPPPTTGWEVTTILAAGLAMENDDQLMQALVTVNPVLAGRCLYESQARVDQATRQAVLEALLKTIARAEVALRVRIAAGEVLGYLGDPRIGRLVMIPAGEFVMGEGEERHKVMIPAYQIGQYPVTNAEYAHFIEARGYEEKRWWTEAGWQRKKEDNWAEPPYWGDSGYNQPNQPVVGVNWYEAVAYCRWLSVETRQPYRLPSEAEWEKATRGTKGRMYPWGDKFEASCLNASMGEQQVRSTTPVGIYPTGKSLFGAYDCAGNVWEWTGSLWGKSYSTPDFKYPYNPVDGRENMNAGRSVLRVLRGGSWRDSYVGNFRCLFRFGVFPNYRYSNYGFRWVISPI